MEFTLCSCGAFSNLQVVKAFLENAPTKQNVEGIKGVEVYSSLKFIELPGIICFLSP